MIIVSIRDLKVEAFLAPIAVPTVAVGVRLFTQVINDHTTEFSKFPEDYVLYELGAWDEKDGVFTSIPVPRRIVDGTAVLRKE